MTHALAEGGWRANPLAEGGWRTRVVGATLGWSLLAEGALDSWVESAG